MIELCKRQVELDDLAVESCFRPARQTIHDLFALDPMLPDAEAALDWPTPSSTGDCRGFLDRTTT